jgi:hypothetical protein
MNKVKYFYEEVTVKEALSEEGSDTEDFSHPENVPGGLRMTMEELAYRTAVWYDPNGKAVMYYQMTTSGIKTRGIRDEDRERSDNVERLPLPGEEPRLLG